MEMEVQKEICQLCLEKCENFKFIEENTKNIFDILLLKLDFTGIQDPTICKNCAEMLIKCFDFKTTCLRTHNYIVPFVHKKGNVKLDLKDVYLNKHVTNTGVPEDHDVCAFCMGLVNKSLDVEKGDVLLKKMMEQCLPEIDLSIFKRPVICEPCQGFLENYFLFVTNRLLIEKKIKKYCENPDINSKGQIEVNSSLQFTIGDLIKKEVDGNLVDIVKVEEQFCDNIKNPDEIGIGNEGNVIKLEQILFYGEDAKEGVEIKNASFAEMDDQEVNLDKFQVAPKNMLACQEESNKLHSIKKEEIFFEGESKGNKENFVEMEDRKFVLVEEIKIKSDTHDSSRFEGCVCLPHPEVTTSLNFGRNIPKSSTPCLKEHLLVHENPKDPLEIAVYKCHTCPYQTKNTKCFKSHLLVHMDPSEVTMHKCDSCSFQTKRKEVLRRHSLRHKDPSEITMYKCDDCLYQTNNKYSLKVHLLQHKDPSEVPLYLCDLCSFKAKIKYDLKKHLLKHKDPSEVPMYKCVSCPFQTKHKKNIKRHLLVHQDPTELTMYKCDFCIFQSKHKNGLKKHLLRHANIDSSEVTTLKCDFCSYQTVHKYRLKSHLLVHKDLSEVEVTTHKCDFCSYQTVHKYRLKNHLLVHKDLSEVAMNKCDFCSFQSKRKDSLRNHLLTHKDLSAVTMHKCNFCSFQSKRKDNLKTHLLQHKDPSEVKMYKCYTCSFQSKRKEGLERHLLQHKDPSAITMYTCESCSFQTKTKYYIKRHALIHKKKSEITL